MRAFSASVALLATLSACALPIVPPRGPAGYDSGALRAELLPAGIGGISFRVNHPAHVAVFEINPGGGVSLLYPRFADEERAVYAGVHSVWRSWASYARDRGSGFASPVSSWGGGWNRPLQPRIYLLVAAERPLRISSFVGRPLSLRAALGSSYYAASPYALLDELTRLVVPSYLDDDWVTDVYVEWPQPSFQQFEPEPSHVIVCRDGRRYVVPWYVQNCPQDAPAAPPLVWDTAAPPPQHGQPQQPERRRPERESPLRGTAPGDDARPGGLAQPERTREPRVAEPREGPREPRPERPERPRPERDRPDPSPAREANPPTRESPRPQPSPPEREATPRPTLAEPSPVPREAPPRMDPAPRPEPAPPQREAPRPEPPPRVEPEPSPGSVPQEQPRERRR